MAERENFDFAAFQRAATERIRSGAPLLGSDGVFTPLLKEFLEAALEGELSEHLESKQGGNRRNGHGRKRVKSHLGTIEIEPPRDREGTFQPEILPKRSSVLSSDLDEVILYLYSQGSSYGDISAQLEKIYGVEVSESTITRVTDKVWPLVPELGGAGGLVLQAHVLAVECFALTQKRVHDHARCQRFLIMFGYWERMLSISFSVKY